LAPRRAHVSIFCRTHPAAASTGLSVSKAPSTQEAAPDFEMILASLLGGVVVLDAADRVSFVNPAAEAFLDRSSSTMIGQPSHTLFEAAPWLADLVARMKRRSDSPLRDAGPLSADRDRDVLAVVSALRDREGRPCGTVIALHNLASRHRLRDEELANARLRELDGLVASVGHELNNPLSGIRGAAQLLSKKLADRPELADYGDMIVRQADRMAELIKVLMALEAAVPSLAPLNIHRILSEVIMLEKPVSDQRGITVKTEFDPSLPEVHGDADQLEQLFLNIFKNAAAVCPPDGGSITVATRMETSFYVDTGSERVRYIAVEIADNGPGLDEQTRNHMFSPFYSRTKGGHGLGLTIARNIVTSHRGRIIAENGPAGGARIRVMLPVAERRPRH
jgi:two-component system nitrogen regulation sensor histidine kinase GlnL